RARMVWPRIGRIGLSPPPIRRASPPASSTPGVAGASLDVAGIFTIWVMAQLDSMTLPARRYKAAFGQAVPGSVAGLENSMKVIGLAGWSGAGKTTLLARLIPYFNAEGLRVSVIKHAHHDFDVDIRGQDSWVQQPGRTSSRGGGTTAPGIAAKAAGARRGRDGWLQFRPASQDRGAACSQWQVAAVPG